MKDRRGHEFSELVAMQNAHLALWATRLDPAVTVNVTDYVRSTNLEADAVGVHRVYRGQDIVVLIMAWPEIPEGYAKRPTVEESVI